MSLTKADREAVVGIVAESLAATLPSIIAAVVSAMPTTVATAAPSQGESSSFMDYIHGERYGCTAGCNMPPMLDPERAANCVAKDATPPKGKPYHRTR